MIMNNDNGNYSNFREFCLNKFDKDFLAEKLADQSFWRKVENLQKRMTVEKIYKQAFKHLRNLEDSMSNQERENEKLVLLEYLVAIVDLEMFVGSNAKDNFIPRIYVKYEILGSKYFSKEDKEEYERVKDNLVKENSERVRGDAKVSGDARIK